MAELTDDQKKVVELEKTVATLTKEKQDALIRIETLTKEKEAAEEQSLKIITELKAQLETKSVGTLELPTVKHGKDTYELVGGHFMWAGREVTLERLKEDAKLVAELVKEGVTSLRKLDK